MRIHIEIPPEFNSPYSSSDPDESPLFAKFGGETVLIELQGQLESEGDTAGRLIGVLGMEGVSDELCVVLPTRTAPAHASPTRLVLLSSRRDRPFA